jgi:hypothetical protein
MQRRKIPNNNDIHQKYKDKLNETPVESLELSHNVLIEHAGGSISNLPIQTKEFNDWIEEQRKLRNPLIGKAYIQAAPEYNSEQTKIGDTSELVNEEADKFIQKAINTAFDVEESQKLMEENASSSDKHDIKFIDLTIIENSTQKKLAFDKETIITDVTDELKKYHNDENYVTEIDTESVVINTHNYLLTQENNTKLLK